MVDWFLGTIGFTYPEWRGSFYPSGLPSNQSLNYYSRVFNAVEINTTFYGAQPPEQLQRWSAMTPDDFRFCLKAPKRVTHELRLKNAGAEMRAFVTASLHLGDKFGAVLLQLPPSYTSDEKAGLEAFLRELPEGPCYTVEFRHASWYTDETGDLLRRFGVGWAATDYEELPVEITPTASFLYVRWIGRHNILPHPGHEVVDRTERLQAWVERIRSYTEDVQTVFGFFDNDYAGHAPASCNRLKTLLGLPVTPSAGEEQGRLF